MATKRGKKSTKKVKSLKAKSLSADKAKRVRGGAYFNASALNVQSNLILKRPNYDKP
jgi:hypothetical protein